MKNWIRIGNTYFSADQVVEINIPDDYDYVLIRTTDGRTISVYMTKDDRNALIRQLSHHTDLYLAEGRHETR
jgi:hypothetical protein